MADFFADLLPTQPGASNGGQQKPPSSGDDVLVSPTAASEPSPQAPRAASTPGMTGLPMVSAPRCLEE